MVYCRINNPWLSPWNVGSTSFSYGAINCGSYPFSINLWVDFASEDYEEQFTAGQIVPIDMQGQQSEVPVENLVTVFTKP